MKIALLGDIAFLGNYSLKNNEGLPKCLTEISEYLSSFDFVVGNLESPFSNKKKTYGAKSAYLCTDLANIEVLKFLNIKAVNIANNHMYDFGKEGFDSTINTLKEADIEWFGADGKSFKLIFEDNKIMFNGFCCYSTNPLRISKSFGGRGINRLNLKEVHEIVKNNYAEGWLNILSIHSGIEHVDYPSLDQIHASRSIAQLVPYVWYGHHPHVIQGIEQYKESVIAHSLGNFIFASLEEGKFTPKLELTEANKIGMILELEINHNIIHSYSYTLIRIHSDGYIEIFKDDDKVKNLSEFSNMAFASPDKYNEKRLTQRNKYIENRKNRRTFSWYVKRLRPRYARMMMDIKINNAKYKRNITQYLLNK